MIQTLVAQMPSAEIISIIALLASFASLSASLYFNLRDRARIIAKSTYYPGRDGDAPSVAISVVNAGRRPIILRMLAGEDGKGEWVGTLLNPKESGYRLAEHERYDIRLLRDDLVAFTPDDDVIFTNLWFEDTLGRRHSVAGARENTGKLWAQQ